MKHLARFIGHLLFEVIIRPLMMLFVLCFLVLSSIISVILKTWKRTS